MNNDLLIVIEGKKVTENYYRYKYLIKEKFSAEQIRPYVLRFPRKLTEEDRKYISETLNKSSVTHKWFTILEES